MDEIKIPFPYVYNSLGKGSKKLFIQYVKGYIASSHPNMKPIRVEGDFVICEPKQKERRKEIETRKKAK